MRVIITGGSGLIGQALTDQLLLAGHEVIVLSRNPAKTKGVSPAARLVKWDARTASGWSDLIDANTAIVNLAGTSIAQGRWTEARKRSILDSRVVAGRAVSQAVILAEHKPKVLIQASAVGFYGNGGDRSLTEASPSGNDFLAGVCRAWENSTVEVETQGVRRVVVRTGVVLSTLGGAFPLMLFPFQVYAGGPVGSGQQWLPWIHIQDQVRAMQFLIEQTQCSGVYNLTAPEPVTNKQFGNAVGKTLQRPAFFPAPAFAMRLALGEMSALLLEGQRALPERLSAAGFKFKFGSITTALADLLLQKISPELANRGQALALNPVKLVQKTTTTKKAAGAAAATPAKTAKAGAMTAEEKRARIAFIRRATWQAKQAGLPLPSLHDLAESYKGGTSAAAPAQVVAAVVSAAPEKAAVEVSAGTAKPKSSLTAEERRAAVAAQRAANLAKKQD
jgi:uncharacterized protein (TIGR01777 family)